MFEHPALPTLSAHYDGELAPVTAAKLDEHLGSCPSCYAAYRGIADAANGTRHLPRAAAPKSLSLNVRDQIDAEDRGMVPVLRGLILRGRGSRGGVFSAFGLGTLATVLLISFVVLLDQRYGEQAARRLTSAWIQSTLPEPVLLHERMSSPRVRSAGRLPYQEVESGREGTVLTLASIDRNGSVQGLEVIYRSGDYEMLTHALDAVRESGFEPARLGNETVSVNFLYLFTTTEVRPDGRRRLSNAPGWKSSNTGLSA